MTLRPRPVQPKPVCQMTPEEYAKWSEDLRKWAHEKALEPIPKLYTNGMDLETRTDPMNRRRPAPGHKKGGEHGSR